MFVKDIACLRSDTEKRIQGNGHIGDYETVRPVIEAFILYLYLEKVISEVGQSELGGNVGSSNFGRASRNRVCMSIGGEIILRFAVSQHGHYPWKGVGVLSVWICIDEDAEALEFVF